MENEPIFSNEIPMPPGKVFRRKVQAAPCEAKPKRKYTRKTPEIPPPTMGFELTGSSQKRPS